MSYYLTDYSATEVEFNDGLRSYYYKKCYCSVELQGEYIIFTAHRVENNAFRQQWSVAYSDFTSPTGPSAVVLAAIQTIINSYAGGGGVTAVTATSPITSSGGTTPNISIPKANASTDGYLSSADWNTFNSGSSITPSALTKTNDTNVTLTLGGTPNTSLLQATSLTLGWSGTLADSRISSASVWNAKQNALAGSGLVKSTAGTISYVSGTASQFVKGDGSLDSNTYLTSAVTSVGATSPITSSGGATPSISTSMATNKLIGRGTAGTGVMEEISIGSGLTLSGTTLSNTATPTPTGYYGAFLDNVTQTAVASNVGYAMILRTVDLSNGISVVSNGTNLTRITFANTGIYNIQFSSQFQNTDNAEHDVTIWLRLNGTDVPGSAGFIQVPKRKAAGAGNEGHVVVSWNYVLSVVAGQYYELMWSTTNNTHVTMQFYAGGSPPPSAASVILTVTQQSGIMAGTGVTAINTLTGAAQTLVTNGSGTDFNIASTGSTHTFNLPTASATNRGALTSTDWNAFNGKAISPWAFRLSGRFYTPSTNALAIGSLPNVSGAIRYSPVIIERDITITQLGISVVTIAGVGNTARVGIYTNNPATNQPLTRLVDSGTMTLDGAPNSQRIVTGLSVTLTKGLYWFAYFSNAVTGTIASIANSNLPDVIGTTGTLNNGLITGYSQTLAYTTLPPTASGLGTISSGASSYCIYYYY